MTDPTARFDLTGRVALITGGSRGLGRSMALGFAEAGAKVVVSSRKLDACEETAAAVEAAGGEALAVACHMGDLTQVEALVAAATQRFGRLDILVNNAANPLKQPIGQLTEDAWDKSWGVNLKGPVFLLQACVPWLEQAPAASVINILSVGAFQGTEAQIAYSGAKSALWQFTRSAAVGLARKGIRVNAIAPGPFATYMVTSGGEEFMARNAAKTLLGRLGDPDEIVGPALFLASDASSFVTGSCLTVDGGMLA
ncbi:MAG: glucose 1-dehydrogenase [Acidimicrobiales bacterium]|jgi:NAD(P)-dependent dehydrogenase (short-subunit alcohol dehydrogenase family)|nr:glucose 1-dehydrogenase [Acidimicrobiales bacterium]